MKDIKLFEEFVEESQDGWGSDPKKPKAIDKIENRIYNAKERLDKLELQWEAAVEKHQGKWQPKYNFGDLLA
jgi:hypothetical protein